VAEPRGSFTGQRNTRSILAEAWFDKVEGARLRDERSGYNGSRRGI